MLAAVGKVTLETPVSGSFVLDAVTVKPPATPVRMKTWLPVFEAFEKEPNERVGSVGGVVSTVHV
jgi:hypothetical protein